VGVEVLYSEHIQTIAQEVPSQQLLTETDNPGGPKGFIGALGMPLLIRDVIKALAELRGTTAEAIIQTVQDNFLALIRGDPWLEETYTIIREG
jgi:TatD DNase family protein